MTPLLILAVVVGIVGMAGLFVRLVVRHLNARGEVAGVPEEPVPVVELRDARDALDCVLADEAEVSRRLELLAAQNPRLMPRRLVRQLTHAKGADR